MIAIRDFAQGIGTSAEILTRIAQLKLRSDNRDPRFPLQPGLAQAGINQRCFPARVGADQQNHICSLQPGDTCVHQITATLISWQLRAILSAIHARRAELVHHLLQGKHRFRVAHIAGNGGHPVT